jgi:pimeloyl-ACP methyl ester carboxylesterase
MGRRGSPRQADAITDLQTLQGDGSDATETSNCQGMLFGTFRNQVTETVMLMRGSIIGLLLVGGIAMASAQERVVTLPGASATSKAEWLPALSVQEQTTGNADRMHPVLYVHGFTFPSALSVFWKLDGRSWADALNDAGYSVWGFDFAGFGGSERYPEMKDDMARVGPPLGGAAEGVEEIARVVTYILARTKATRVSIVAHSRGTIPAGLFATQHPELVDRLVFFGPATQRQLEVLPDGLPSSTSALQQWRLVTAKNQQDRFVAEVPKGHDPVLLDRHFRPWARAYMATDPTSHMRDPNSVKVPNGPLADLIDAWRGKLAYDPAGIKSPLLIVRGEWDSLSNDSDAGWLLAAATSSPERRYLKIPEATHLMLLEEHRDDLHRATNEFLLGK